MECCRSSLANKEGNLRLGAKIRAAGIVRHRTGISGEGRAGGSCGG
jgi:hypothetical protein